MRSGRALLLMLRRFIPEGEHDRVVDILRTMANEYKSNRST